jgi:hypothetical protein
VFGQKTDRFDIYLLNTCSKFLQQKKNKKKNPQKHFIFGQICFWEADPTNKLLTPPSQAEGQQGFHLHTSGFEPSLT